MGNAHFCQNIQENEKIKLFDRFTKVETARAYSRAAAKYCIRPRDIIPIEYGTAAKVYCTQAAFEVALEAIQIHGAYGLTGEYLIEKLFRDARDSLIIGGVNDLLKMKRAHNILENYVPEGGLLTQRTFGHVHKSQQRKNIWSERG